MCKSRNPASAWKRNVPPRLQLRRPPPNPPPKPPPPDFLPPEFLPPNMALAGYVFSCSNETMDDCFRHHIFGLEYHYRDSVARIRAGMHLFLFNTDTKLLHGVYRAISNGDLNIDRTFCPDPLHPNRSRLPAQVRFAMWDGVINPPLMTMLLRPLIDYVDPMRFRRELIWDRVHSLVQAFVRVHSYCFALALWMNGGAEPVIMFN